MRYFLQGQGRRRF